MDVSDNSVIEHADGFENVVVKQEVINESEMDELPASPDPMGLLEETDLRNLDSTMINEEMNSFYDSDENCNNDEMEYSENWDTLCKKYKWIAWTKEKGYYCAYCDSKVHDKRVYKHSNTISHKEYEANYLAFKKLKGQNNSNICISKEVGPSNEASKGNELFNFEEFSDFIWDRWFESYKWLERLEGTIGFCKYCNLKFDVKYIHLRERHEKSQKHKDAVKNYEYEADEELNEADYNTEDEVQISDNESGESDEAFTMKNWMFNLQESNKMSYCVLCDYLITRINFKRHTRTRHHLRFLSLIHKDESIADKTADRIKNETLFFIENNNFINDELQKKYDWVSYDPQNSLVALCKVCNKDITHPCSETKLRLHERIVHGELEAVELQESATQMKNEERNEVSHSESEENSEDSQGEESDYKTYQKKRIKRLSDEWFKVYKCYRKSDDPQYIYCSYCKVPLLPTFSRYKHEKCARHQQGVKRSLVEERKNLLRSKSKLNIGVFKRSIETKSLKSNDMNNMKVKIMHLQKNYPWVKYNPKELQPDYVLCTICNDRVFVPTPDSVKKHEKKHEKMTLRKHDGGLNKVIYRREREIENQFSYDSMENDNIISEALHCEILMPEDPKNDNHKKNMQNLDLNDEVQILEEPVIKVEKDDMGNYQTNAKRMFNSDADESIMPKRVKYTDSNQSVDDAINILCKFKDKCTNANSSKSEIPSRNTYDLFFDSVSETVKKLPNDLAAEAKVRVSSVIYELEVRAMQREQGITDSQNLTTSTTNDNSVNNNDNHNLLNNSDVQLNNSFGNLSTIQSFRTVPLTGQSGSPANPNTKLKLRVQKHIIKPSSSTPVASNQKVLSFVRTSEQQLRLTSNAESVENLEVGQETETNTSARNHTSDQLNPIDRRITEASPPGLRTRSLESMSQNAVLPIKLTSAPTSNLRQTNLFSFNNGLIRTKSSTET